MGIIYHTTLYVLHEVDMIKKYMIDGALCKYKWDGTFVILLTKDGRNIITGYRSMQHLTNTMAERNYKEVKECVTEIDYLDAFKFNFKNGI